MRNKFTCCVVCPVPVAQLHARHPFISDDVIRFFYAFGERRVLMCEALTFVRRQFFVFYFEFYACQQRIALSFHYGCHLGHQRVGGRNTDSTQTTLCVRFLSETKSVPNSQVFCSLVMIRWISTLYFTIGAQIGIKELFSRCTVQLPEMCKFNSHTSHNNKD